MRLSLVPWVAMCLLCGLALLSGCGGGSSPVPKPPAQTTTVTIDQASPVIVTVSGTQQFTATVTGTTNTAVTWSVQEGAVGGSFSDTVVGLYTAPATPGTYHIIATSVTDPTKTSTITVTVAAAGGGNTAPTAAFTVTPASGTTATTFTVNASSVTDAQDAPAALEVRWDWENDGIWDSSYTTTKTANHQYAADGTYTIAVEVRDSGGLTATATQSVTVMPAGGGNTPPSATFTVTPGNGTPSTVFAVNASGSSDAQDAVAALQVRWDWENDGVWDSSYSTTKTASHSYGAGGTYTIALEVRDSGGLTATATRTVSVVANTAPTAVFTVTPASGTTATAFTVDASGSSDAQDAAAALQVRWDWTNNGTWDTAYSAIKTATYTYTTPGTYTLALEVRDTGGLTATTTRTVTVAAPNTPPTASFTVSPASGTTTTQFTVDATGSSDAQDPAASLQVRWDWTNDGTWDTAYSTSKSATRTYASAGNYTIKLEVRDTAGLTATATRTVTVTAAGPAFTLVLDGAINSSGTVKATTFTSARMLNASGQEVKTASVSGANATFDMTGLTAGTYFVEVNGLANDLVPVRIDNTGVALTGYVGTMLRDVLMSSKTTPTYRIRTYSSGQGHAPMVRFTNGAAATPPRYAYYILALNVSPYRFEMRVLGSNVLLSSETSTGTHNTPTWITGTHASDYGGVDSRCTGCHGNLDTKPAAFSSLNKENGFCFKCHYGKGGSSNGWVDPTQ